MKRLRFAAIMAVGLLLAFVLCACGQAPDTADPGETAAVTGESAAGETTAAAEVVSDPVGFVTGNVIKEGVCVEAVFLGIQKQPLTLEDGTVTDVDTIWIYYSDGTFEQFATVDNQTVLFSVGTYAFEEGGDFIYMEDGDLGDITINRTEKYVPGQGLAEHESSHTYDLDTLGFTQLYAPDAGKNIVTIFTGPEKQPFEEIHEGEGEFGQGEIDTWWIYFNDGTFEQYAQVHGEPVLFSCGTYEQIEEDAFAYSADPDNHGTITINRTQKYKDGEGLVDYESSHDYELATLGFDQLFVIV